MFADGQSKLMKELSQVKHVSVTTDIWTSASQLPFIAVTGHFYLEGQLQTRVLDCCYFEGHHTGERIAEKICEILSFYKIENKV